MGGQDEDVALCRPHLCADLYEGRLAARGCLQLMYGPARLLCGAVLAKHMY